MNKRIFPILLSCFLLICIFTGCKNKLPICNSNDFNNSLSSVKLLNGSAKIMYTNIKTNEKSEIILNNKNISEKSYLDNFSLENNYFISNNSAINQNDIIISTKDLKLYVTEYSRCKSIGESKNCLYFYSYSSDFTVLLEFNKDTQEIREIDKMNMLSNPTISKSSYLNDCDKLIWSYFNNEGTWLCQILNGSFSKFKLSDNSFSEVFPVFSDAEKLICYKGYDVICSPYLFNPQLYFINTLNNTFEIQEILQLNCTNSMSFLGSIYTDKNIYAFKEGEKNFFYVYKNKKLDQIAEFNSPEECIFKILSNKLYYMNNSKISSVTLD